MPRTRSKKRRAGARARAAGARLQTPPETRVRQPAPLRESVEDPLEDWADDPGADRWLLEREAEDIQRGEG